MSHSSGKIQSILESEHLGPLRSMVPDLTMDNPRLDPFWHDCRPICPLLPAQEPCWSLQLHRGIAADRKYTSAVFHSAALRVLLLQFRRDRDRDSDEFCTLVDWLLFVVFCHYFRLYLCGQVFAERGDPDPEAAFKNCFPQCCSLLWGLVFNHTGTRHIHRNLRTKQDTRPHYPLLWRSLERLQTSRLDFQAIHRR